MTEEQRYFSNLSNVLYNIKYQIGILQGNYSSLVSEIRNGILINDDVAFINEFESFYSQANNILNEIAYTVIPALEQSGN